ncbi:thioredoxin domain-containing protein [Ruicaihuangia caeni]|uniref:Thioredoxin domain-containing protein n=1 Tax=Ruicaihuangia caeni TaxID=3042517 RepID=A0AAW6TC25_9MICO|nr:thioredoxin domain-containing protein [Klugiella sp. YN-L-19]MDI2099548.1 thioredoxin domain-containing protein [Klugiella sp. YN-L-19]
MAERLADALSPYLRAHADNPVDWWPWGEEAFAEAARRDVPVLVSIGYSTCHWCHVMARESFSDPILAEWLNARFVAVKVDREEHPDVDSSYLAAASAFTRNLGWPLTAFATPRGRVFFAGTYFPPSPVAGQPSFRQVLEAVDEAWRERRAETSRIADQVADAVASASMPASGPLPTASDFDRAVATLLRDEDRQFGGFGGAPKFPVASVLQALLDRASLGDRAAGELAERTLDAMAASALRDPVEGGFFRYATLRNWRDPHYERMLTDNALLLTAYARAGRRDIAAGVASFLDGVLRVPGGFGAAQDSESVVDGRRVEGGYYLSTNRDRLEPPAVDDKVLTGWNGLAIGALAEAGSLLGERRWVDWATDAADLLLERHRRSDGTLLRATAGERVSPAPATLEDYGMLADGLLRLACASAEVRFATAARELLDACLVSHSAEVRSPVALGDSTGSSAAGGEPSPGSSAEPDAAPPVFVAPGEGDPVLTGSGLAVGADPSEGAYPSGLSAAASASYLLFLLDGDRRWLDAAQRAMAPLGRFAIEQPIAFGTSLGVMSALDAGAVQLVVVSNDRHAPLAEAARRWRRSGALSIVVTEEQARAFEAAGFELFAAKSLIDGVPAAYLCREFVCRLPVTGTAELTAQLAEL